eukprot:TRINITY_DN9014_c0_g1_i1.p1 TRINITY_DN9014_c0_g1~~TRINITY_DN9014_c0_g1_i1.p1  ORF type:complete len:329 (-),score=94.31 TRINITY_DN9014_c0_g1_i1:57-899(-)
MGVGGQLASEDGKRSTHVTGMFYRVTKMLSLGIKPIFVFDGEAPAEKEFECERRHAMLAKAKTDLEEAKESGDGEEIAKYEKRVTRVSKQDIAESKELLKLLGVPIIDAPGEAEAECAALCAAGLAYGTGSEDMDSLTLGSPILLRHLTASKKTPVMEINLQHALTSLNMTQDQFIDLCILLGCDYTPTIKGVGPKRAIEGIQKYGDIETMIKHLDSKFTVPPNFNYEAARRIFKNPSVNVDVEVDFIEISLSFGLIRNFVVGNFPNCFFSSKDFQFSNF